MNEIFQWVTQQLPQNVSGPAAFFLLATIASYLFGRYRHNEELLKIRNGRFSSTILIQACVLRSGVLILRNLLAPFKPSDMPIPEVLLKTLIRKASETTVSDPEISLNPNDPSEGHLLHATKNYVMGACNQLYGEVDDWIIFITSEVPGEFVKRSFIRIILIKRNDLKYFKDFKSVMEIKLEDANHWFRILTLHILANKKEHVTIQVPIERAEWKPSHEVSPDWHGDAQKRALQMLGDL
jgi:hypothetical protein